MNRHLSYETEAVDSNESIEKCQSKHQIKHQAEAADSNEIFSDQMSDQTRNKSIRLKLKNRK